MTMPLTRPLDVSVVTPTYNRARLIERALNSVRLQTHRASRIIVVDDGSVDGTPDIARAWSERHSFPVHVEVLERNGGPAVARNRGIELAESSYVAFLDSDDEHLPDTLATLCAGLDDHPDAVFSFGDACVVSPDGAQAHGLFAPRIQLEQDAERLTDGRYQLRNATETLLSASIIPTSATCFRRDAARAVGGMPVDFRSGEDWQFFLRMTQQGRFIFTTDDVAVHHRHDDNLTSPNAGEFMAREKLRGLLNLQSGSLGVKLNTAQRQRVTEMLQSQQASWRFHLSKMGLSAYWAGLQGPLGHAIGGGALQQLAADPKSLLRALHASLKGLA
jgi:glycosyltransferase involved in cell wall biosynthesis